MKRTPRKAPSYDEAVQDARVQAVFADPRYVHLRQFGDHWEDEPETLGYDRGLTLQALAAIYSLTSSETQSRALTRATWAMVGATAALVIASLALIFVD